MSEETIEDLSTLYEKGEFQIVVSFLKLIIKKKQEENNDKKRK